MPQSHGRPSTPERHVVLVAPEVPWNTGNIGRTCIGAGATLHLIKPLGFSLASRDLKRAGLDYWHEIDLALWESFAHFAARLKPEAHEVCLCTKIGQRSVWEMPIKRRLFLVFGSETKGLPASIRARYPQQTYYIPIRSAIRSLNLSTAVGIVLYTSLRDRSSFHGWPAPP
jgi:tRNA (cytidine/uridine-2'-O-)-methyltransferase